MNAESNLESDLRIQLKVSANEHPELFAELRKTDLRGYAAKRLKALATLGLFASRRRIGDVVSETGVPAASQFSGARPTDEKDAHVSAASENAMLTALLSNSADFAMS